MIPLPVWMAMIALLFNSAYNVCREMYPKSKGLHYLLLFGACMSIIIAFWIT